MISSPMKGAFVWTLSDLKSAGALLSSMVRTADFTELKKSQVFSKII